MKKCFIVMLSVITISGCSTRYSTMGDNIYLRSQNGVPLVVPPPLTSENVSHFYDLPPQKQNAVVSIAPPSAEAS